MLKVSLIDWDRRQGQAPVATPVLLTLPERATPLQWSETNTHLPVDVKKTMRRGVPAAGPVRKLSKPSRRGRAKQSGQSGLTCEMPEPPGGMARIRRSVRSGCHPARAHEHRLECTRVQPGNLVIPISACRLEIRPGPAWSRFPAATHSACSHRACPSR